MAKLRKLELEGFRGALKPLSISFREKSHFIYSENGFGKSTISDALEFLATGDLHAFHREDCTLGAAIHVDADRARVVASIAPSGELRRTLEADAASELTNADGQRVEVAPIPMLRHATIQQFMDRTAGAKRQALLKLLDLERLSRFRQTLKTAEGAARERNATEQATYREEASTLQALLGGEELLTRARELAETAGVAPPSSIEELRGLGLTLPPGQPNRQPALTELERAVSVEVDDPTSSWNEALADEGLKRSAALASLLEQGEKVLADWPADSCPLCEVEQGRAALEESIGRRSSALAESRRRLNELRSKTQELAVRSERVAQAITAVLAVQPPGGWPSNETLGGAERALNDYAALVRRSVAELKECPPPPTLGIDFANLLPKLRATAETQEAPETVALQSLYELRIQHCRAQARRRRQIETEQQARAIERLRAMADETIKEAIEAALAELEHLVGRYFAILMRDPTYTGLKLVYEARRSGQVEFSFVFDGRHTVKPPQRIMSESQLNALGLALLLARVKTGETSWRTLVLDDVVNSFDLPHRQGLVELLRDEFGDWQVILLSHDSVFRDVVRRDVAGGWSFLEITHWTPKGGPVLSEGEPLNRLAQELAAGAAASGLGGLARAALEQGLSRPLAKLGYKIAYDPAQRYTAFDYLHALRAGLRDAGSPLADLAVLGRMDTAQYTATRAVHWRADLPEPTADDLRRLVDDLRELDSGLRCANCNKRPWFNENQNGWQCECGQLRA